MAIDSLFSMGSTPIRVEIKHTFAEKCNVGWEARQPASVQATRNLCIAAKHPPSGTTID
jgi:hypothetical protein